MVGEMVTQWLVNVVSVATGTTAIVVLVGILDRAANGRIRDLIQRWLYIKQTKEQAEANGEKLDRLHHDHMETMGAQVAVARHTQELSDIVCEQHDVDEHRRPDDLKVDEMQQRAAQRGAAWPGEFTRGGD